MLHVILSEHVEFRELEWDMGWRVSTILHCGYFGRVYKKVSPPVVWQWSLPLSNTPWMLVWKLALE
jgi:hypothetical protein